MHNLDKIKKLKMALKTLCRASEIFNVVVNVMTVLKVLYVKCSLEKLHNRAFLPHIVTSWKFCIISQYFSHSIRRPACNAITIN